MESGFHLKSHCQKTVKQLDENYNHVFICCEDELSVLIAEFVTNLSALEKGPFKTGRGKGELFWGVPLRFKLFFKEIS